MKKIFVISFISFVIWVSSSCKHKQFAVPSTPVDTGLCFDQDILPIFVSQCAKSGCHDQYSHEEDYVLDSYDNITSKGITPGNAGDSKLYEVLFKDSEDRMPKDAPPLTDVQINLIKRWIDAGAKQDTNCGSRCDTSSFTFNRTIMPLVNKYCTGCHSGVSPSGNFTLVTYNDVKNAVQGRNLLKSIRFEPGYSAMPKGGVQLSACEIRQIEKWVEASMPDN